MVQNLKWATAHLSIGWGAARQHCAQASAQAGAGAPSKGHGRVDEGRWARGTAGARGGAQVRQQALGGTGAGAQGAGASGRGSRRGAQAWARPRRAVGPTGCALGALSLFLTRFDSVLFLS